MIVLTYTILPTYVFKLKKPRSIKNGVYI